MASTTRVGNGWEREREVSRELGPDVFLNRLLEGTTPSILKGISKVVKILMYLYTISKYIQILTNLQHVFFGTEGVLVMYCTRYVL
jgi:hypothetical protein